MFIREKARATPSLTSGSNCRGIPKTAVCQVKHRKLGVIYNNNNTKKNSYYGIRYRFTIGANALDTLEFIDPLLTDCIKYARLPFSVHISLACRAGCARLLFFIFLSMPNPCHHVHYIVPTGSEWADISFPGFSFDLASLHTRQSAQNGASLTQTAHKRGPGLVY